MHRVRNLALALGGLLAASVGAGCGFGPGETSEGVVRLTVTKDYGHELILEGIKNDPSESETVLRVLDREAEIETRYGGGFVQSIEGISGGTQGDRTFDWFFYVNGVESEIGSAEAQVSAGDHVWWDHRDWTEAMRVPAVVGSWPEPFRQSSAGSQRLPVRVVCGGPRLHCRTAQDALADAGVSSSVTTFGNEDSGRALRLIVGEWEDIRQDETARLLERGPEASGIFARIEGEGLSLLDERGNAVDRADGLVAATRNGEQLPTWLVTGTTRAGIIDAVGLLDASTLRDRYAIASPVDQQGPDAPDEEEGVALPVIEDRP